MNQISYLEGISVVGGLSSNPIVIDDEDDDLLVLDGDDLQERDGNDKVGNDLEDINGHDELKDGDDELDGIDGDELIDDEGQIENHVDAADAAAQVTDIEIATEPKAIIENADNDGVEEQLESDSSVESMQEQVLELSDYLISLVEDGTIEPETALDELDDLVDLLVENSNEEILSVPPTLSTTAYTPIESANDDVLESAKTLLNCDSALPNDDSALKRLAYGEDFSGKLISTD